MSPRILRLPPIPLPQTLAIALGALVTLFALMKPISTIDLNGFMRMGAWMAEHGVLLEQEPFTLAAEGVQFQNGTWLSQYLLFQLYHLGGYPALQVLLAASTLLTLTLTTRHVVARAGWRLAPLGVFLTASFLLQNLAIRPQTFSPPLFAGLFLLLDRHPNHKATPILAFLTMAFWTNTHGAFPIAFAIPAAFWLEAHLSPAKEEPAPTVHPQRWLLIGLVMFAATCANPYGPMIYRYILENSALPVQRGLEEWLPVDPISFFGIRFYLALVVIFALALKVRRQVLLADWLLLAAFTLLAVRSQRMIIWWGIVSAPLFTRWVADQWPRWRAPLKPDTLHTKLGWAMLVFWLVMAYVGYPGKTTPSMDARGDYVGLDSKTPVAAVSYLAQAHQGGRIFHRLEWGSYIMWRLWPNYRPFIDIRVWIQPKEAWEGYLEASQAESGWTALMEHYMIDTLLLSRETQAALIDAVTVDEHWHEEYRDPLAVVFRRVFPPNIPSHQRRERGH